MNFRTFAIILINLFSIVKCAPIVGGERVPDDGWFSKDLIFAKQMKENV